jgi:hypothetical protein
MSSLWRVAHRGGVNATILIMLVAILITAVLLGMVMAAGTDGGARSD